MSAQAAIVIDEQDLARIDKAAEKAGMSRSAYLLSWCPDVTDGHAFANQAARHRMGQGGRKSQWVAPRLPTHA
jgi:hypothetical protein